MNDTADKPQGIQPPPMRGIHQAIIELKKLDPYTALTEKALRRMVKSGELPSVRIGNKALINMNVLYSYLYKGNTAAEKATYYGGIRAVAP